MMMEARIYLDDEKTIDTVPLHEHIVRYLMHHGIAGATVFTGLMGYGAHHHLKEPRRFAASDPIPVMIVFVDEEEKIRRVIPYCRDVAPDGLIVAHTVQTL